jgi:death on curing protein
VTADEGDRVEPIWVTLVAADAAHTLVIRTDGGSMGLRDAGLLESALARAQQRWSYDPAADLAAFGAAYCVGIAKNHAFVDGNKRTAFQIMVMFLYANGLQLEAPEPDVVALMVDVATGTVDEPTLAAWIRSHTRERLRPDG